ncbi:hypothetical protein SteCoe_32660 [Stentor coeruleus]|uniref:GST N-terminal domain-containing protein n=1 Tax=Stentor coeruleus TaxID=5963 RepID=A0A1R2AYH4_9CILI|nr:hypothetical protein SteCoe_32660 [Stentor coeruleus]
MSDTKVELVVHPLCPYAQRALYTAAFKSVPAEIIHVSLANPEAWFLDLNPLGEVPSCKVTRDGQVFKLTESLNISEYFDSFPGPSLYPRQEDGKVDPVAKCIIDVFIKLRVGRFSSAFYLTYGSSFTEEDVAEIRSSLKEISDFVEGGNYVMHKILGKNELTFADLMLLPHAERFYVYREFLTSVLEGVDCSSLWAWYEKLAAEPWAQTRKAPVTQLLNLRKLALAGGFKGLDLPLSLYE